MVKLCKRNSTWTKRRGWAFCVSSYPSLFRPFKRIQEHLWSSKMIWIQKKTSKNPKIPQVHASPARDSFQVLPQRRWGSDHATAAWRLGPQLGVASGFSWDDQAGGVHTVPRADCTAGPKKNRNQQLPIEIPCKSIFFLWPRYWSTQRGKGSSWANVYLALFGLGQYHGWVVDHLRLKKTLKIIFWWSKFMVANNI